MANELVYLATASCDKKSEVLESIMQGKEVDGIIGNTNHEGYHTQLIEGVDLTKAKSTAEQILWSRQAADTEANATYFFYSTSLDELRDNMLTFLTTPNGLVAYTKADRGVSLSTDETIGGNKATLLVLSIPANTLDKMIISGMCERREGEYGTDNSKVSIPEVALGDKAVIDVLQKGQLLEYDRVNRAMNNTQLWSVPITYFGGKPYTPSFEIKYTNNTNSTIQETDKTNKVATKQIVEARLFLKNLIASGASKEDIDLAKSAVNDWLKYAESQNTESELGDN